MRQAFLKFARAHPLFDGRHCALLVTDCSSSTVELTCQISVANAMDVAQVTSDVREAMVEFIAKEFETMAEYGTIKRPSVNGANGDSDTNGSCIPMPLPPLTKEDEKMGEGSKTYHTYSCASSKGAPNFAIAATTTALDLRPEHVRVNVDETGVDGAGLTRRSVRDADNSPNSVPMVTISNASVSEN
jgi:hypothetical protein